MVAMKYCLNREKLIKIFTKIIATFTMKIIKSDNKRTLITRRRKNNKIIPAKSLLFPTITKKAQGTNTPFIA